MDQRQAFRDLEVIRTLMERTCQYQVITAKAGLVAGALAVGGALTFLWLDSADPNAFAAIWGLVFFGAAAASVVGAVLRHREWGEPIWSRQAKAVVTALVPSFLAGLLLTIWFFHAGLHQRLPGIWMLCYAQGLLATAAYAPTPIRRLGFAVLAAAAPTLFLDGRWSAAAMGAVFGIGHLLLGVVLLRNERMAAYPRIHRDVA